MKSLKANYSNKQNSTSLSCQRGFFSVGIGLGLAALYGVIAGVVVANNQPDATNTQVSQQQVEAPLQTSAYMQDYIDGNTFPVSSYD